MVVESDIFEASCSQTSSVFGLLDRVYADSIRYRLYQTRVCTRDQDSEWPDETSAMLFLPNLPEFVDEVDR